MRCASSLFAGVILVGTVAGCGTKAASGDDTTTGDAGGSGEGDGGSHGQTPTNITLVMHHRPANPGPTSFVVAYQDGAGPWTAAPAPSGDTYTLPIYAPAYAIAWTCISAGTQPGAQVRQVDVLQFAVSDRTAVTVEVPPRCGDQGSNVTLHGAIQNTGVITSYVVRFGDRSAVVNQQGQYALQTPPGTHDLIVLAGSSISATQDFVATEAVVQRALSVTANTELDIDAGDAVAVQSFGVNNFGGGTRATAATTLYTANGTVAPLVLDATPFYENESLDTGQMAGGDVYDQQLTIAGFDGLTSSTTATATPGDETWTSVPALGAVAATAVTTPYPRVTATWASYPGAVGYSWLGSQAPSNSNTTIVWTAQLSASVVGSDAAFTMPDLSGVAGWNPALQMVAGTRVTGGVQAMTSSLAGDFPAAVPPTAGTHRTFAAAAFAVTP